MTWLSVLRGSTGCSYADWEATEAASGCNAYASGTCQALARCGGAFLSPYGSYAACEQQLSQGCTDSLGLPDVVGSGAGAALCGEMMRNVDCNALTNGELPVGCQAPSGKRSDGAPCRVGAQCASARCTQYEGGWGVCRERATAGEWCGTQSDCGLGFVCSLGTCVVLGRLGDLCGPERPCRAPLGCVAGACTDVAPVPTCQDFAVTMCARIAQCSASVLSAAYSDEQTCAVRNAASCLATLNSPDPTAAAIGFAGCTRALATASCQQLLDHASPQACQLPAGMLAPGEACSTDAQCSTTRCARSAGAACGVCSWLGAAGEPCTTDSDCSFGLVCGGGSCRVPGALGEACDPAQRCAYPFLCVAGSCQEASELGASCNVAADSCDRYAGLICGSSGTCEPWLLRFAGQPCNQTPDGWAACSGGSTCVSGPGGDICSGPLPDGSPCNPVEAPFCFAPAQCLAGVCTYPNAVECR